MERDHAAWRSVTFEASKMVGPVGVPRCPPPPPTCRQSPPELAWAVAGAARLADATTRTRIPTGSPIRRGRRPGRGKGTCGTYLADARRGDSVRVGAGHPLRYDERANGLFSRPTHAARAGRAL